MVLTIGLKFWILLGILDLYIIWTILKTSLSHLNVSHKSHILIKNNSALYWKTWRGQKYFYHFSDELTHNFVFTHSDVEHLTHLDPELEIIRIKSDNCSTQYKSKNVFGKYKQLASEKGIPVICYYWVFGHGKGLVDVMSGFGAKGPLRKAVVTQDLHCDCASNIVSFLKDVSIITRSTILSLSLRKFNLYLHQSLK